MNKYFLPVVTVLALGVGSMANAEGLAVGAKVGTLGTGVELTGYALERLNLRFGLNYLTFDYSSEIDDIEYDMTPRFASALALADWHAFGNNFRITAGVAVNQNEVKIKATPTENETIGDNEYTPEQIGTLKGKAEYDSLAPYFGVGFGNAVKEDTTWTFSFDLGLIFQSTPGISLSSSGPFAHDPQFEADLEAEEAEIQDEVDSWSIYPVLSFGIAYYFW